MGDSEFVEQLKDRIDDCVEIIKATDNPLLRMLKLKELDCLRNLVDLEKDYNILFE